LTEEARDITTENVKKPKHRKKFADPRDMERLGCNLAARVVVITEGDFNRLWKLAKEAIHFNVATRTGQ
jgi:hypothetical protein